MNIKCNHTVGYCFVNFEEFDFVKLTDVFCDKYSRINFFKFCPDCGKEIKKQELCKINNDLWDKVDELFDEVSDEVDSFRC